MGNGNAVNLARLLRLSAAERGGANETGYERGASFDPLLGS
jgi:hypothetical protein